MVLRSQRDGLGSSSQAPRDRTSRTRGVTEVPAVGQRSGAQGPDSKGSASRSGVWVCGATLTWLHSWAGGVGEGIASSDRTLGASDGTEQRGNKRFSTRPSSGRRSGVVTISWRAGSRGSGSPVSGTPPALALHRLGRGEGGMRRFPAASSTLRPLWRLLLLWPSWSGGGGSRRAPSATSRWRGCSRRWGGDSSRPPGQDVTKRLRLLLCCGELVGKVLHRFAE